jgi:methionyl-tRNA synthetase
MKRKEAKQGYCEKCKKFFYIHAHHIEPKEQHGKAGKTADPCPNCHTHVHEYMNKNLENPSDKEEVWKVWNYWLHKVPVTWILLIGLISVLWHLNA